MGRLLRLACPADLPRPTQHAHRPCIAQRRRLTNTQFSLDELEAAVEEAAACGTYVCAHAYTAAAIARAVRCGVRSIEHGNCMDEATAGEAAGAVDVGGGVRCGWRQCTLSLC
jgi:imidazolonepropionase-like amidohydrolase